MRYRASGGDTIYLEQKENISLVQNLSNGFDEKTTITVQWLGLSCYCPNWIETSHLNELKNDTLGIIKDEFSISLLPSDTSNNIYKHPNVGNQTPLIFELKGKYYSKLIKHESKGMSYEVRTFRYDSFKMIEY